MMKRQVVRQRRRPFVPADDRFVHFLLSPVPTDLLAVEFRRLLLARRGREAVADLAADDAPLFVVVLVDRRAEFANLRRRTISVVGLKD